MEPITVVVRKRPINSKELKKNDADIVNIRDNRTVVINEKRFELCFPLSSA